MSFRLGLVGHKGTYNIVRQVVKDYFNDVELYYAEFDTDNSIDDTILRIRPLMDCCDGLLYSRYDPYLLFSNRITHTIPARYVAVDTSHLIASLMRGMVVYDAKLTDISIDGFDEAASRKALAYVGMDEEKVRLRTINVDINMQDFMHNTVERHAENYNAGSKLCVTNISAVYVELLKRGVPAAVITPSTESFIHEIRNLMLQHQLRHTIEGGLAVISGQLAFKERFRFYREMPLREIDEYSHASKLLHVFAEKLDGALYMLSRCEFVLMCESGILQNATNAFTDIEPMEDISHSTAFDAFIGIGFGRTAREAGMNSRAAMTRSCAQRGTNTHVIINAETVLGPIVPSSYDFEPNSGIDEKLLGIASQTGISFATINKLFQATRNRAGLLYTSDEIAGMLNITQRTANRLIERLLDKDYAAIAGHNIRAQKGRPSRMIKLLF